MPDSFSELRAAGGPNRPWVIAGVATLVVALIGVAIAAGYRLANPREELSLDDVYPLGAYHGTLRAERGGEEPRDVDAVAHLGGKTGTVTFTGTGCTAYFSADGSSTPLTGQCAGLVGDGGSWDVREQRAGIVTVSYSEDGGARISGHLVAGTGS